MFQEVVVVVFVDATTMRAQDPVLESKRYYCFDLNYSWHNYKSWCYRKLFNTNTSDLLIRCENSTVGLLTSFQTFTLLSILDKVHAVTFARKNVQDTLQIMSKGGNF